MVYPTKHDQPETMLQLETAEQRDHGRCKTMCATKNRVECASSCPGENLRTSWDAT